MSTCRSCGQKILWAKTESGKLMPVDPDPVKNGKLTLYWDEGVLQVKYARMMGSGFRAHFVTCPDAEGWRKR